ncbi:MAG: membrane protein insertion efficiency factor YidD [Opitutus sp.]|nr:membrane protein insertion efficiency factor YidD [Opitutus sp.]
MSDVRPSHPAVRVFAALPRATVAVLRGLIWVYQKTVSPALSVAAPMCGCRFAPTCSHYAQEALREHGLLIGLTLSLRRLVKCGPWHEGGIDPVPARKFSCEQVHPRARSLRSPLTAHCPPPPARSLS